MKISSRARTIQLTLLLLFCCGACTTPVQHDLEESAANELLVLFESAGIQGETEREGRAGGWVVSVSDADIGRARSLMMAHGLPRRTTVSAEDVLSGSLLPSPTEERLRLQQATAGELERTFMALPYVLDARVHLAIAGAPEIGFSSRGDPVESRASILLVFATLEGSGESTPISEDDVRRIVVGAVADLSVEDVVVVSAFRGDRRLADAPDYAMVGPFKTAPSSRASLQATLAGLVLLIVLLSAALVIIIRRRVNS